MKFCFIVPLQSELERPNAYISLGVAYLGAVQMKGRVFDTMSCRTMLIEDFSSQTLHFFDEGKDFVMSADDGDMLEKIRYYLLHDTERQIIADSGYNKVTTLYNSKNVLAYMFNKAGFEASGDEHYPALHEKFESLR